jgi:TolB-like protein/tetratricopeptide (TPR) repeat protein
VGWWAAAAGLVVLAGGGWMVLGSRGSGEAASQPAAGPADKRIVVFPFENMGPAEDAYFAAGIAEEITSRLAALQGLGVLSRTSAVQYDRKGKTMQTVAAELGVDYVLDGSVRWARGTDGTSRVRITPQLIQAREDRQVWSQSFDRSMSEIFGVQSEIAGAVVDELGMTLVPREREALDKPPTTNLEAFHAFLRAHEIVGSITFSVEDWTRAVALLEEACAKDPGYLRAHAELGTAHAGFLHFAWDTSQARLARSKAAVDRALALDPRSPWSQWSLGYYHYWGRKDYESAYAAFSKVREGLPGSNDVLMAMAFVRRRQGRFEEAAGQLERATPLDPRNAMAFFTLGETQTILRRYDEAQQSLDHAIALSPDASTGYTAKARAALLAGDAEAARVESERASATASSTETRGLAFWTAVGCRDFDRAQKIAAELPDAGNAQFSFECRPAARGWVMHLRGDGSGARAEFDRARTILEAHVRAHPEDANPRSALGLVLAQLGRGDEALREARAALDLYPATHDAWIRQFREFDLAIVEMLTGRKADAVARLAGLLEQPSDQVSVGYLRLSPLFDPLRDDPGFVRLLQPQ